MGEIFVETDAYREEFVLYSFFGSVVSSPYAHMKRESESENMKRVMGNR